MLYRPELFEPLAGEPWDEGRVRAAIRSIVADADGAYSPDALWPAHEWDGWSAALPLKNVYVGAAGVAWALDALARRGLAEPGLEPGDVAVRTLAAFRAEPDFIRIDGLPVQKHSALFTGEAGIVLVAWRLAPSRELADDLLELVRRNIGNEANEIMWGVPGTLLAARAMLGWTGEQRWRAAAQECADALREERDDDGLWTQQLFGERHRSLGVPHGLVGNVATLGDETLWRDTANVLARTAIVENSRANWPAAYGRDDPDLRLQWCRGSPGIVVAAADYLDEELLLAGARLVWEAGAPNDEKGAGICHGTAGNGYALLKTFERTGDELWLERARVFAMHALAQAERLPGRYSLFTGGVGVALYAADCLAARPSFPVLDGFG